MVTKMDLHAIFKHTKDVPVNNLLQDIYSNGDIVRIKDDINSCVTDYKQSTTAYTTKLEDYKNTQFLGMFTEANIALRSSKLSIINGKLFSYLTMVNREYDSILSALHYKRVDMEVMYRKHLYNGFDDETLTHTTLRKAERYADLESRLIALEDVFKAVSEFGLIVNEKVNDTRDLGYTLNHALELFNQDKSTMHLSSAYSLDYTLSSPYDFKVATHVYANNVNAKEYQYTLNSSEWLFRFINRFVSRIEDFFVYTFKSTNYVNSSDCRFKRLVSNAQNAYTTKDNLDSLDCGLVRNGRILVAYDIITSTIIPTFMEDIDTITNVFEDLGTNHNN